MTETKLCKDCKHYRRNWRTLWWLTAAEIEDGYCGKSDRHWEAK